MVSSTGYCFPSSSPAGRRSSGDLRAVLRHGGERLRRDELAPLRERAADVGQLPVADIELAQVRRRRAGPGDDAVACVIAREHDLAPGDELRLAAVGRDAVEVDVARVLEREDDRVAVPDRLAHRRVRTALTVERGCQDTAVLTRRRVDDRDLGVPREVEGAGAQKHAISEPSGE